MGTRIKLGADGSLRLPPDIIEKLGWKTGSFIEVSVSHDPGPDPAPESRDPAPESRGALRLVRVEVDPFAEAMKPPPPDALEKALGRGSRGAGSRYHNGRGCLGGAVSGNKRRGS